LEPLYKELIISKDSVSSFGRRMVFRLKRRPPRRLLLSERKPPPKDRRLRLSQLKSNFAEQEMVEVHRPLDDWPTCSPRPPPRLHKTYSALLSEEEEDRRCKNLGHSSDTSNYVSSASSCLGRLVYGGTSNYWLRMHSACPKKGPWASSDNQGYRKEGPGICSACYGVLMPAVKRLSKEDVPRNQWCINKTKINAVSHPHHSENPSDSSSSSDFLGSSASSFWVSKSPSE
jgi:hypothetical protein